MYISVATTCELHMEGLQLRMRAVYSWELRVVQFTSLQSIETVEMTTALVNALLQPIHSRLSKIPPDCSVPDVQSIW